MKIGIKDCARCGKDHQELEFKIFTHRPVYCTHWSLCPVSGEPILMAVESDANTGTVALPGIALH